MRIAIFSDNFYPELSGISDSITLLAQGLVRRGHKIRFYVPAYPKRYYKGIGPDATSLGIIDEKKSFAARISFHRLSSIPYPTATGQGRAVLPTGLRWVDVHAFSPNIIHTQLFYSVGLEALLAARLLRIPLIGTNHTAVREFLRYSPIRAAWADRAIMRYVNWYYGKCNLTTAPSRSTLEEMRESGFRGECLVISNPIDTKTFHPFHRKAALKKKLGFSKTVAVHAGRLAPERKVDVLLRATAVARQKIPTIELVLAGNGVAEKSLQQEAKNLGIAGAVKFLGRISQTALAETYNASDVFVTASTSDTQSLTMMQAMATGLPTIGVRARGLPEYIHPGNGMLAEPDDSQMIAGQMVKIFRNRALREKLGGGALSSAKEFSAPSIAAAWEAIYEMTIARYYEKRRRGHESP